MTGTRRAYFEQLYAKGEDPWGFATSWYERRKYALTVASLPRQRYVSAFEPGCSIGILTEMLATRCEQLLSFEMIEGPLERSRSRLSSYPQVELELASIPEDWPDRSFDLVVLSEIAYYFDKETLASVLDLLLRTTSSGANVVGVHWRGETDYPLTGDEAHHIVDELPELSRIVRHRESLFALDIWERA